MKKDLVDAVEQGNIQQVPSHVLGQGGKKEKAKGENWKKEKKNYGERAQPVIISAGLNGGINQYLWHNFMRFTMAYNRGPAERISPWGTHVCLTGTFVLSSLIF